MTTRTNYVTNPSFETNTTGWSSTEGDGQLSLTRNTSTAAAGSACLQVSRTFSLVRSIGPKFSFTAPVGGYIGARVSVRASSGTLSGDVSVMVRVNGGTPWGSLTSNVGTSWVEATSSGPTTPCSAGDTISVEVTWSCSGTTEVMLVDAVIVEILTTRQAAGAYFDGATTDTATLEYAWSGTANASTSTATQVRRNLIPNPSFEVDTTGWAVDAVCTIARSTATSSTGSACLAITKNSSTASFQPQVVTPSGTSGFPVTAGTTYTAQCKSKAATTARTMQIQMTFYDSAGAVVNSSYGLLRTNSTSAWTTHDITGTAGTGAAYARVKLVVGTGGALNEVHYVDDVMVEATSIRRTYFDGSITDTGTSTYSWSGTAHNSASMLDEIPNGWAEGYVNFGGGITTVTFDSNVIPSDWSQGGDGTSTIGTKADTEGGTTQALYIANIGNSQEGWAEVTGSNFRKLRYQVSSETGWDFFKLNLDSVEQTDFRDSGTIGGWRQVLDYRDSQATNFLGSHTLRFRFTKDSGSSAGDDGVWIGQITYDLPTVATGGHPPAVGTASGSFDFTGSTTGSEPAGGTGSGGCDFAGTTAGSRSSAATASGAYTFSGSAVGETPPNVGAATGSFTFAGSSAGSVAHNASATGAYAETGSSVGTTPTWQPHNLQATAVSGSQIDLTWDALDYATAYDIERDGVIIAFDVATNSYSDTGLTGSTLYTYRVRAVQA